MLQIRLLFLATPPGRRGQDSQGGYDHLSRDYAQCSGSEAKRVEAMVSVTGREAREGCQEQRSTVVRLVVIEGVVSGWHVCP
jgi:hypothetical protein